MEDVSKTDPEKPEPRSTDEAKDAKDADAPETEAADTASASHGDAPRRSRRSDDGTVIYPNVEALSRPLDMPPNVRRGTLFALIAAAVIGIIFLIWYFDGIVNEPKRQQEAITETLAQDVSYDLPNLYSLMPLDDASIYASLEETGATLYEMPVKEGRSLYEVIKLPAGMSVVDAGAMYLSGIDTLSAAEAARLLLGSWDLEVDRENGVNMALHYADFKSGSVDAVVQDALSTEGLTDAAIEDSGEDNAGNTYVMGTIDGDAGTYSWRVSALPLSKIYNVQGLPDDAVYVGIRMTS